MPHFRVQPRGTGIFGAVSSALGASPLSGSVELGALWAALPEVSSPPPGGTWPLALPVLPRIYAGDPQFTSPAFSGTIYLRDQPGLDTAEAVDTLLTHYPAAAGVRASRYQYDLLLEPTPWGIGAAVRWPTPDVHAKFGEPVPDEIRDAHVTSRVPLYQRSGEHWLIPRVGDGQDYLPAVLLWWVLLFGLSLLARYEPCRAAQGPRPGPVTGRRPAH